VSGRGEGPPHAPDRPPVAPARELIARHLRSRLLPVAQAMRIEVPGRTHAAVLVPLHLGNGALHAVFTKRREDLRRHPGEISFPGGRRDAEDADLLATALREAEEEIGLAADEVEVLGALQPTPTIATSYAVYPFVGLIEPGRAWSLSPREVARVLELPLHELQAGYGRRRLLRQGLPIRTETYVVGDDLIWGATARMLADLIERLRGLELPPATAPGPLS
jgi:8-oxo-dGTP pyrophosphatase MutT (NUDIX family)